MKTFLLFMGLFLVGCQSHPKDGDWYEHKGTRERYQIKNIGTGASLNHSFEGILEVHKKVFSKGGYYLPPNCHYDISDSNKDCVVFEETIMFRDPYRYIQFTIVNEDKLSQDYQLVK
jgi:hypothetical protein